jgi:hypothetical protein
VGASSSSRCATVGKDEVTRGAAGLRVGGLGVRGWERGRPWHWAAAGVMDAAAGVMDAAA